MPAQEEPPTTPPGLTFKQAVGNRRSVRFFLPHRPVDRAAVQKILEAARLQSGPARRAVVVYREETEPERFAALCEALYNQPQAAQAPVHIYWTIDAAGDPEWLSAIDIGLGMGSALLAAVDEGLGTTLLTGRRAELAELLGIPPGTGTVAQVQLVGHPAEPGGRRARAPFEETYFEGTWGNPVPRDQAVVDELTEAGMIQGPLPVPRHSPEIRAMAAVYGLPE